MRIAIMSNEKASIVCFEQFIEAFLTESSKSPALIAESNKQWWLNSFSCNVITCASYR